MRRISAAVGAIAIAGAVITAPSTHAATRSAPVHQAAGVVVVKGSATGHVVLRLPRAARLDITPTSDNRNGRGVAIAGAGRIVGVVLGKHVRKDKRYDRKDYGLYALRFTPCGTPRCTGPGLFFGHVVSQGNSASTQIAAGDYDLYLVADGAPTTVTLTFSGLSGRRTVAIAADPAAVQWSPPVVQEQIVLDHGTRLSRGERFARIDRPSLVVVSSLQHSDDMRVVRATCIERSASEVAAAVDARSQCARARTEGNAVAETNHQGSVGPCVGLCTVGLEDGAIFTGFVFFGQVDKQGPVRLIADGNAQGHFGTEGLTMLLLPW